MTPEEIGDLKEDLEEINRLFGGLDVRAQNAIGRFKTIKAQMKVAKDLIEEKFAPTNLEKRFSDALESTMHDTLTRIERLQDEADEFREGSEQLANDVTDMADGANIAATLSGAEQFVNSVASTISLLPEELETILLEEVLGPASESLEEATEAFDRFLSEAGATSIDISDELRDNTEQIQAALDHRLNELSSINFETEWDEAAETFDDLVTARIAEIEGKLMGTVGKLEQGVEDIQEALRIINDGRATTNQLTSTTSSTVEMACSVIVTIHEEIEAVI